MTLLPRGHGMICHALACNKTYYDTDFFTLVHICCLGFFNCASRPIFLSPDCIQMRGKLENCLQLLRKKYQGFHLDSEFFFRWLFRFHSHCHYYVPRFRPSLYFTSSLFPNLPAVASKIILLRKSYVFTLQ